MPRWRILVWVAVVSAALLFVFLVREIILPFVIAFIIAALLEPTVKRISLLFRRPLSLFKMERASRTFAIAFVIVGFFATVGGIAIVLTPNVSRQTNALAEKAQQLVTAVSREGEADDFFVRWNPVLQIRRKGMAAAKIDEILSRYSPVLERFGLPSSRREIMEQYVDKNRPMITKTVKGISDSAFGIVTGLFSRLLFLMIVPLLVWLMLADMDNFKKLGPRWIPPSIRGGTLAMLTDIGQVFVRYLRGITIVILIYGAVMTFFLGVMGVPSWILLGPIFAVLYLIPYFGNIISACVTFTVIGFSGITGGMFHPFANPWTYALLVTGLYFCIGLVFDHLIYPQMVGNSVGLSPVLSMFVIFCGGALFGLPGMLIAFPLAGSVKIVLDRLMNVTLVTQESLDLPPIPLRHRTT
jgi:predicted PurR-regulated permease PerM